MPFPPPPHITHILTLADNFIFDSVLEVVDKALDSAADEKNQTKKRFEEVDQAFMKAINELASYEKDCHTEQTVIKRMASAKMNDIRVSTFLESLKAMSRFSPKVRLGRIQLLHLI
jgi:hypothetical protein